MMNNGYQPIRKYKGNGNSGTNRYFLVIIITALIVAGIMLFIMSLTGTGMFSTKQDNNEGGETMTTEKETEEETEEETTTAAVTAPPIDDNIVFTTVEKKFDDSGIGDLVLLDADHPFNGIGTVRIDNISKHKTRSYSLSNTSLMLRPDVVPMMNAMFDRFVDETGFTFCMINGAYRSFDYQSKLYDSNPTTAALPGCSDYHTGCSFLLNVYKDDLVYPFSKNDFSQLAWLSGHAHEYGMIFRYPFEKKAITGYDITGQMRYVGIAHSTYMLENDLCLEEYIELLRNGHAFGGEHITVSCADGYVYQIYYVYAAAEGITKVPVPENREYTVSGDNCGGFIVTVKTSVASGAASEQTTAADPVETTAETVSGN